MNRGKIQHVARAQQINNFENMRFGKITPTDIDGAIEYKDKAYMFIEIKYREKDLPFGQRLALERLVKDTSTNKTSIAIVCEHYVSDTQEQIDVADCIVREIFLSTEKRWRPPNRIIKVKDLLDLFIGNYIEKSF